MKTIEEIIAHLEEVQRHIEFKINSTPTGMARNKLCDANLHLMSTVMAAQDCKKFGVK